QQTRRAPRGRPQSAPAGSEYQTATRTRRREVSPRRPGVPTGDSPMFAPVLAEFSDPGQLLLFGILAVVGVIAFVELCGLPAHPSPAPRHVPVGAPLPEPAPQGESAFIPVGQRGRQRAILREGVYAVNLALFVVMTETAVYRLASTASKQELTSILGWQKE